MPLLFALKANETHPFLNECILFLNPFQGFLSLYSDVLAKKHVALILEIQNSEWKLNFSSDFHFMGHHLTSGLFLQGWPKLIFKKQTYALCPWVRGKNGGVPLVSQGFVFF